jgi:hypothetical protein
MDHKLLLTNLYTETFHDRPLFSSHYKSCVADISCCNIRGITTTKKNTFFLSPLKKAGLRVNIETIYMSMPHHQDSGQNHNIDSQGQTDWRAAAQLMEYRFRKVFRPKGKMLMILAF